MRLRGDCFPVDIIRGSVRSVNAGSGCSSHYFRSSPAMQAACIESAKNLVVK
jgi:hypothetical protein